MRTHHIPLLLEWGLAEALAGLVVWEDWMCWYKLLHKKDAG